MIKDYREIKETVMLYVNGCATGEVELLRRAFHEHATMYGYLNGELLTGGIENLYASVDSLGASPGMKAEIDVINVVNTIATVQVKLEDWHGLSFTDIHSLVKVNGKWMIVAKIFHQ